MDFAPRGAPEKFPPQCGRSPRHSAIARHRSWLKIIRGDYDSRVLLLDRQQMAPRIDDDERDHAISRPGGNRSLDRQSAVPRLSQGAGVSGARQPPVVHSSTPRADPDNATRCLYPDRAAKRAGGTATNRPTLRQLKTHSTQSTASRRMPNGRHEDRP